MWFVYLVLAVVAIAIVVIIVGFAIELLTFVSIATFHYIDWLFRFHADLNPIAAWAFIGLAVGATAGFIKESDIYGLRRYRYLLFMVPIVGVGILRIASYGLGLDSARQGVVTVGEREGPALIITRPVIAETLTERQKPKNIATYFFAPLSGTSSLYFYASYEHAIPNETHLSIRWYRDNVFVAESCPFTINVNSGAYYCRFNYAFTPANYEARLLVNEQEVANAPFRVVPSD